MQIDTRRMGFQCDEFGIYIDRNNLCFNLFIVIRCVKKLDKIKLMWILVWISKLILCRNKNKRFVIGKKWSWRCIGRIKLLSNHSSVTNIDDNNKNTSKTNDSKTFESFVYSFIKILPNNWQSLEMKVFPKRRDIAVIK